MLLGSYKNGVEREVFERCSRGPVEESRKKKKKRLNQEKYGKGSREEDLRWRSPHLGGGAQ